jgi:hypothetical protein
LLTHSTGLVLSQTPPHLHPYNNICRTSNYYPSQIHRNASHYVSLLPDWECRNIKHYVLQLLQLLCYCSNSHTLHFPPFTQRS